MKKKTEMQILEILLERPNHEFYGLELVNNSGGKIKRGTVYVVLGRMQEKGLVTSKLDDDPDEISGIRRRRYRVTGKGVKVYELYKAVQEFDLDFVPVEPNYV